MWGWLALTAGLLGLALCAPAGQVEAWSPSRAAIPNPQLASVELLVHATPADLARLEAEHGLVRRRTLLALDAALLGGSFSIGTRAHGYGASGTDGVHSRAANRSVRWNWCGRTEPTEPPEIRFGRSRRCAW